MSNKIKKIVLSREFFLLVIILIIVAIVGAKSNYFLTLNNLKGLILSISVYGIIATGLTILLISGGFDISMGSTMSVIGVILGILLNNNIPVFLSIAISLVAGAAIGMSIGFLITKFDLNPFVLTLGYSFFLNGLSYLIGFSSKVRTGTTMPVFGDFPKSFTRIAGGSFHGIEYITFYLIFIIILFQVLLTKNVFFRQNFYVGGNEYASKVAGLKVNILKIFNYSLVSFMVAIAAILRASRVGGTTAGVSGITFGLIILTGVILGGGNFKGGSGSVMGSFLGVTLLSIIYNSIIMLGIDPFYGELFIGSILLISILINIFIQKKALKLS